MPTYVITAPDGRKFRVTAPDGASKDEVLRYAQQNAPEPVATPIEKPEAEDPGALTAGMIGAGRVFDRLAAGARQMVPDSFRTAVDATGRALGMAEPPSIDPASQAADTAIYAGLRAKRPGATLAGEVAPMIAALPAVGSIGGAAAISALPGLVEYGTPEERIERGAMGAAGGALGAGVGKLIGRMMQPIRVPTSKAQQAAQDAADRLGVQLRPGEITGSRPLKWLETSLNDLPFSGGMGQAAERTRREAINAAGARALGQPGAAEITDDVLAAARRDTGAVFDNLLEGREIELGAKFRSSVSKIVDSKVMKALRDDSVEDVIAPFKNMPAGKIKVKGEWFQQNKTALDTAIRSAYIEGKAGKAMALQDFEKALVDAASDSMNATERAAFRAAQKQWATLRLLETGQVVEAGNIMPGRLNAALINRYKAGGAYKEGKITGELADIGRLGQAYKPLPQSGTAPRAVYSAGALFSGAANPLFAAGAMAAPPLAQKFLQSDAGRRYLTRGMAEITPEIERRLMQGGYGLLGLPLIAAD